MGGGGSIQGMNTSLKNNRMLLRTSRFNPKKKSFFNRRKEYIKAADGFVELKEATPEELHKIRKKILLQRRNGNILSLVLIIVLIPFFVYFSFHWFKTERKIISSKEMKAVNDKKDDYTFFINDGDSYLEKGKWHNAIFQYNKVLELFPSDYDAHYRLAYAYTYRCRNEKINCEEANSKIEKLLEQFPNNSELIELEVVLKFLNPE